MYRGEDVTNELIRRESGRWDATRILYHPIARLAPARKREEARSGFKYLCLIRCTRPRSRRNVAAITAERGLYIPRIIIHPRAICVRDFEPKIRRSRGWIPLVKSVTRIEPGT